MPRPGDSGSRERWCYPESGTTACRAGWENKIFLTQLSIYMLACTRDIEGKKTYKKIISLDFCQQNTC